MKKLLLILIFFGIIDSICAQDIYVSIAAGGNWNDAATWDIDFDGIGGDGIPGPGDIASIKGDNAGGGEVFLNANVEVAELDIQFDNPNVLRKGGNSRITYTITITGALAGYDEYGSFDYTAPIVSVIENNNRMNLSFTGADNFNPVIFSWSNAAPLGNVNFNGILSSTEMQVEDFAVLGGTTLNVNNGILKVNSGNSISQSGNASILINTGAEIVVDGAINGDGSNTSRFNSLSINGSATTGTSGYINLTNISISSTGILRSNFSGSNQTQGWWYQNIGLIGTFSLDPASTVIYNSSVNQNVAAIEYGNLTLRSPGGASVKTLQNSNTLSVDGNFTINSGNVTFNSTTNANNISVSGNLINNGTWSPSQLVIFNGALAQSINGNNAVTFNGGVRISNTIGVSLSNIGMDINGELDVDPGCLLDPFDQDVLISGNMRIDGTLQAGTDRGFTFDGTTNYFGSGSRNFYDFTIAPTGTVSAPLGTLNVNGDFTNNGTFDNGGGTFNFTGAGTKIINGSNSIAFNNLNLSAGTLQVAGNVDLENVMTISASTNFDADGAGNTGVFTLKSDGVTDGAISTIPASATISGNFTAERFIDKVDPSLDRGYHIFGSSLEGVTVADIQAELPINGTFTGASGYTGPGGTNPSNPNNPSLYRYVESTGGAISARYVAFPSTNSSATFLNGEGYSLFTFTGLAPVTINGRGTLKRDAFSRALSFTGSGADAGWHTVANPYPAPTDWVAWGKTNVEGSTAYIYDPTDGSYTALDGVTGQQLIPRGQGFFVRVTSSGSVSATEATKVTGTTPDFFRQSNKTMLERFEIVLKRDSSEDIAIVSLQEGATDAYEGQYDATRLLNILETLSTKSTDGKNLKVNRLAPADLVNGCSRSIDLNMEQMRVGIDYKLEFRDLDHLPMYSFELVDHFLDQTTSIQNGMDISFTVTSDLASKGSDRFELVLSTKAPNAVVVNDKELCASERAVFNINNSQSQVTYLLYQDEVLLKTIEGMASSTPFEIENDNILSGLNNFTLKASALNCDTIIVAEFTATKEIALDLTVNPVGSEVCSSEELASFTLSTQNLVNYFITDGQDTLKSFVGTGNAYTGDIPVADLNSGINNLFVRLEKEGCESGTLDEILSILVGDIRIDQSISYFGTQVCGKNDATVFISSQADIDYTIFAGTQKVQSFTGDGNQQSIVIPSAFLTDGTNQFSLQASYMECESYVFKKPIEVIVADKEIDESISYFGSQVCDKNDATVLINSQVDIDYTIFAGTQKVESITGDGKQQSVVIPSAFLTTGTNQFNLQASYKECAPFTYSKPIEVIVDDLKIDESISYFGSQVCDKNDATVLISSQADINYTIFAGTQKVESFTGDGNQQSIVIPTTFLTEGINEFSLEASYKNCESFVFEEPIEVIVADKEIDQNISYFGSQVCDKNDATVLINSQADIDYTILAGTQKVESITGDGKQQSVVIPSSFLSSGTNQFTLQASYKECASFTYSKPIEVVVDNKKIDESISYFNSQVCDKNDAIVLIKTQADIDYTIFAGTQKVQSFTGDGNQQSIVISSAFLTIGKNQFNLQASYKDCESYTYLKQIEVLVEKGINTALSTETTNTCIGGDAEVIILNAAQDLTYYLIAESDTLQIKQAVTSGQLNFDISNETLSVGSNAYSIGISNGVCVPKFAETDIEINVFEEATLSSDVSESNICLGETTDITVSSNLPISNYQLLTESGELVMENQSGVFTVEPIENVSYTITATSINGCPSNQLTASVNVDVLEIPTVKSDGNILSVESNGDKYQWYKDGAIIEGENSTILVVEKSGNYAVEITKGACLVLSDSFSFDASILSNLEKLEAMVSIHPNPVSSELMIDFEGAAFTEAKISIFTLSGRFVNRYTIGKSTNIIDLTSLEKGTYLIQLDTELGFLTKRIVKN